MKMEPKGCNVNYGKCPNYIDWLICIINCWKWGIELRMWKLEREGVKGCSWIFYRSPSWNVNYISIVAFIFCIEITALGYQWRIVLIVVDNAWWLGKLKLIIGMCHWVWRLKEYIKFMCCVMMCIIIVYMHCVVLEEIGDVLHGLGEDRGWTSKPDVLGGDRGWTS